MNIIVAGDFFGGGEASEAMNISIESVISRELVRKFKNADLAILNLESPLTDHNVAINKSGPAMKAPAIIAERIKEMGVSLVTLANNHIMDYGHKGFKDTLETLNKVDLNYVGVGSNQEQAQRPHIVAVAGKKLAVLNFCENEWSTTQGAEMGANPINEINNFYQIQNAKVIADYVLIIAHGGHEHYSLPSPRVKKLYRFYADAGADAVIAHHTHCTSGYEVYNSVPIIYSLGNFLFANKSKRNDYWNRGLVVSLNFHSDSCDFSFTHINQCNGDLGVQEVSDEESALRNKEIKELNRIINDDTLLKEEYRKFLSSNYRLYRAFLEPHANRYLQFLQNRHLLPSLWSKRKKTYLLNLIRCEAHRDVVINYLEDENSHS